jgi:hypothetical protein
LKDLRALTDLEVQRLNPGARRKRRGKYRRHPRVRKSGPELVVYLREKGFRTKRRLESERSEGEPNEYDCRLAFGSWMKAKEEAFGVDIRLRVDRQDVVATIFRLGLWSRSRYILARMQYPDLPSYRVIRKRWGRWGNLVHEARKMSVSKTVEAYMKLMRRFGRLPNVSECEREGLSISEAVEFFGSKAEMDEYVSGLEAVR